VSTQICWGELSGSVSACYTGGEAQMGLVGSKKGGKGDLKSPCYRGVFSGRTGGKKNSNTKYLDASYKERESDEDNSRRAKVLRGKKAAEESGVQLFLCRAGRVCGIVKG